MESGQLEYKIIELLQETARSQERIRQLIDSQEKLLKSQEKFLGKLEIMQTHTTSLDYRLKEENKSTAELQAQLQEVTATLNLEIVELKEVNERRKRLVVIMSILITIGLILATVLGIESVPYLLALATRVM